MVKSNELRLGNFLTHKGDKNIIMQVVAVEMTMVHLLSNEMNCISCYYKDVDKIPLTEERLKNFGYVEKHQGVWINSVVVIMKNEIGKFEYLPSPFMPLKTIDFVHELQNLHFALTGDELTPKQSNPIETA